MISEKSIASIESFDLVIFGANGDLAFRKIFPALYFRYEEGQIKKNSRIAAMLRRPEDKDVFMKTLRSEVKKIDGVDVEKWDELLSCVEVVDAKSSDGRYNSLEKWFDHSKNKVRVYYLATPSSVFGDIAKSLDQSNLITHDSRIVLEKPLGKDGDSSAEINQKILQYFSEDQVYRIDHYLGKETVQNLMVLRFANYVFESTWNSNHVKSVQITAAEKLGVGSRGGYYDQYGALLDMVQNHLLQLLCLIAMEPPSMLTASQVRTEKLKILQSLRKFDKNSIQSDTVRGQYARGKKKDKMLASYLEEVGTYESDTETFVALKTYIDNWRWKGVPFYLRTGKRMSDKFSEIVITFKEVPHNIFPEKKPLISNKLIIRLQPKEKIEFVHMIKVPGPGGYRYKPLSMKMDYMGSFVGRLPEAYERLMMDVVRGNQTLFMSNDEVKASWEWIASISKNWETLQMENELYMAGTDGPGDKILDDGEEWHKTSKK